MLPTFPEEPQLWQVLRFKVVVAVSLGQVFGFGLHINCYAFWDLTIYHIPKGPNVKYIPQSRLTVPNTEAIDSVDTADFGTLDVCQNMK